MEDISPAPSPPMEGDLSPYTNPRLEPRPWRSHYVLLRALAAQIRAAARRNLPADDVDVVDIGCGARPYEPLLRPHARSYVGVDITDGPAVDVVSAAESLPFEDGSFNCVLCTQVLEHSLDPAAVCGEVFRILRPGGVAFVSTHGVIRYHPAPSDFWRWTHSGLDRLLRTTGEWRQVDVYPNGGTASALAYLIGREIELASSKIPGGANVARAIVLALNATAWNLDRAVKRSGGSRPPGLAANYLAVCTR